jgi:hypothetical protein
MVTAPDREREAAGHNRATRHRNGDPAPSAPLAAACLLDHTIVDLDGGRWGSGYCHPGGLAFLRMMKLL